MYAIPYHYCYSNQRQLINFIRFVIEKSVPRLFRSAENIGISSVLIISTAVTCVYVIYVCWQTKNSAEKTGVFMHKLANIVDENHFYETVSVQSISHYTIINSNRSLDLTIPLILYRQIIYP